MADDPDRNVLRLRRFLERVDVRIVLSVCIIASLTPLEWMRNFDGLFLAVFGLEFLARVLLMVKARSSENLRGGPGGWALLLLDLLALISFLPLDSLTNARWLRLFRLTRMILLVGYWAPLVRDVWSVLLRRERARQVVLMGFVVLTLSFTGAVVLDQLLIERAAETDFNSDGVVNERDRSFLIHLWWAFRQIQDPGNMLSEPTSIAALVISVALTVFGLFLVSFLIGLGTDVVRELMQISRLRPPGMQGHTVVMNITPSTQGLLHELMRYYRKLLPGGSLSLSWVRQLVLNARQRLRGPRYVVIGRSHDPPDFLRQPELARIVYRQGDADDDTFLERADVSDAQRVVLLADLDSDDPDADTIHAMLTLTERMVGPHAFGDLAEGAAEAGVRRRHRRARLLIAEILDESNVPAAHAAIAAAGAHTRAFVVPTERLMALFLSCVARDGQVAGLLEDLLTSRGHELYTCFFDMPGLGYRATKTPTMPETAGKTMKALTRRGLAREDARRVLPVGLLLDDGDTAAGVRVVIHPEQSADASARQRCRGFVALSCNFEVVRSFAEELDDLREDASEAANDEDLAIPELVRVGRPSMRRVMVAGFRSATVGLVEALLQAEPELEVLVLIDSERAREEVFDDFDAHTNLVKSGLMKGPHAVFQRRGDEGLCLQGAGAGDEGRIRVRVVVGNQTSSRQLTHLPYGFEHVAKLDAVILISKEERGADARTVKTLMKTEALMAASNLLAEQRIVAEVLDRDLALRLRGRYEKLGHGRVRVFSIQELRSIFMFQSVVVPSFDLVYQELLCPWGQSFVRLRCDERGGGFCTFAELADHLRDDGHILLGVECVDDDGNEALHVGTGDPACGGKVPLARLRGAWVVAPHVPAETVGTIGHAVQAELRLG